MIQLMIVSAKGNQTRYGPFKSWSPDLSTGKGARPVTPKGGIAGAFSQPAEYLGRYAWEHYGGTEKTRALAWKAQKEVPIWFKKQIVNTYWFNKYYAKKVSPKKNGYGSSYRKLQTSKTRRKYVRWRSSEQQLSSLSRYQSRYANKSYGYKRRRKSIQCRRICQFCKCHRRQYRKTV